MKKMVQLDFKNATIEMDTKGEKQIIEYDKDLLPLYSRNLDMVLEDIDDNQELQLNLKMKIRFSQFKSLSDFLVDCSELQGFDLQLKSIEQDD